MSCPDHWVGVVSRAHVQIGVKGGFVQLNHGKKAPLQKFHAGDRLVMYSPRIAYPDGEPLQSFTALGSIVSGEIYQVEMASDFKPYRIGVRFRRCEETPIKPLTTTCRSSKARRIGVQHFRFGLLKIPAADFALIARAMGCAEGFDNDAS